jgi:hypothetical protein
VWLSTRIETRRHRGGSAHALGEDDLFRWMTKPAMLGSEQLLLTATKFGDQVSKIRNSKFRKTET